MYFYWCILVSGNGCSLYSHQRPVSFFHLFTCKYFRIKFLLLVRDSFNDISFYNNSAIVGIGSAIFVGEINETISNMHFYRCNINTIKLESYQPTVDDLFHFLINVNIDDTNNAGSYNIISSNPNSINL